MLIRLGFTQHRKGKGSHVVFKHVDGRRTIVPMHEKDVPTGTLLAILKDIGISKEDLLTLR